MRIVSIISFVLLQLTAKGSPFVCLSDLPIREKGDSVVCLHTQDTAPALRSSHVTLECHTADLLAAKQAE